MEELDCHTRLRCLEIRVAKLERMLQERLVLQTNVGGAQPPYPTSSAVTASPAVVESSADAAAAAAAAAVAPINHEHHHHHQQQEYPPLPPPPPVRPTPLRPRKPLPLPPAFPLPFPRPDPCIPEPPIYQLHDDIRYWIVEVERFLELNSHLPTEHWITYARRYTDEKLNRYIKRLQTLGDPRVHDWETFREFLLSNYAYIDPEQPERIVDLQDDDDPDDLDDLDDLDDPQSPQLRPLESPSAPPPTPPPLPPLPPSASLEPQSGPTTAPTSELLNSSGMQALTPQTPNTTAPPPSAEGHRAPTKQRSSSSAHNWARSLLPSRPRLSRVAGDWGITGRSNGQRQRAVLTKRTVLPRPHTAAPAVADGEQRQVDGALPPGEHARSFHWTVGRRGIRGRFADQRGEH